MNRYQIIRIAALLAVIFVAGLWTGRLTAPEPEVVYIGGRSESKLSEVALARMARQISLTSEEQDKVRVVLEQMEVQVSQYPVMSTERINIFREFVPKVKAQLPPEKHAAVDRYARDIQRRFESARRQGRRNR
jgi:hypothetical protein